MKFQIYLAFACFTLSSLAEQVQESANASVTNAPKTVLSIDQVISEVLSNNQSLKAARANWEGMKERIPQARAWEDPRVGLDATAGRFVSVPPNSFTDYRYTAEQTIPLSGRNRLQAKVAESDAASSFLQLHRRELDLTARAHMAYYRLANAYEQLALNRKNTSLLKQYADISRAKYEVGTKPQSDVLTAETELGKQEESRFDLERQVSEAETELNVLMNRPAHTPLPQPVTMMFAPLSISTDNIDHLALAHRPELQMARKKIEAARSQVEIAKKGWIPEPRLRVEASQYNEASQAISEVAAGISFNLPWFNRKKYSAAIRENKNLLESSEYEMAALRTETLGLVRNHLKRVETFHHHTELFHDKIIPLATQTVTATRLSYETDKATFLNLIEAQRTLQDAESMYWNHLADYLSALAELEAIVGADPKVSTDQTIHSKEVHHE
ncbi:MAG: Outer rane efflux protein [Pedosphaera sp.]|nr:Outer rane efflux protein [Pedosphaera sp.]